MRNYGPKLIYLVLILLLFLNDQYFKYSYPGIVTGKLSDFAGIACLCIVITTFTKNRTLIFSLFSVVALGFVWWKSPHASGFIAGWNKNARFQISRVVDLTDLIALSVIPILFHHAKYSYISTKRLIRIPVVVSSLFIFISTAGTHGRMKQYEFNCSKDELRKSILNYFDNHQNVRLPDSLLRYKQYVKVERLDSDSINFYFYLPYENEKIIYWTKFSGSTDNWDRKPTLLMLIGVLTGDQYRLQTKDSVSHKQRHELALVLEREVISKLQENLGMPENVN
ncbi:hypothetical protein [Parapedobacter sp. 2B3]|uniref:hypothetical protein n=1 Tax=Parapedobacter sp. 2B3 TaxID=3342381 RepID=UPI0035B634F6